MMRWIYRVLKFLVLIGTQLYFRHTPARNKRILRAAQGPAIFVSNHPNTLMDVLQAAMWTKAQFSFLANAGLFQTTIGNWFFTHFFCIPIQRKEDNVSKRTFDNNSAFAKCDEYLGNGGCLYIAPEGTSWMDRQLYPFKTGTARIALSAAAQTDFKLDLKIVMVGLTYDAPAEFRSRVFLNVAEPLYLASYKERYAEDPYACARELTDLIEAQVTAMIYESPTLEEEAMMLEMELLLELRKGSWGLELLPSFKKAQQHIRELATTAPAEHDAFAKKINDFSRARKQAGTSNAAIVDQQNKTFWQRLPLLLLGLPLHLYGFINHALPIGLVELVIPRLKLYVGYISTGRMVGAIVLIPIFYWIQSEIVASFVGDAWSWWYLLSLPFAGLFSIYYYDYLRPWWYSMRMVAQPKVHQHLRKQQHELLDELERFLM